VLYIKIAFLRRGDLKQIVDECISDGLMHVAAWHRRTPESKFTKFGEECPLARPLTMQNFVCYPTRSVQDIRDRKFVLPEKVGQNLPKSLKTCYPVKPPIVPNFIEIGETTLEKSVTEIFLHPSIFWLPMGTPWANGHRSGWWGPSTTL